MAKVELMPHQKEALERLDNRKILYGGTGSGKSLTAAAYYVEREASKPVYVITTAKKRDALDWEREFTKFGVSTWWEATRYGVLVVDSWNNISKYVDVEDAFFIFDEQRLVGTGKWVKTFQKIAAKNNWILLSATPGDTWMDYVPVFIANGFYRNATQFKREHVVYAPFVKYPKIVRYLNTELLEKYRNIVLVEMPYEKHTNPIEQLVPVAYDDERMKRAHVDRWNVFENEPIKDVGELFRVMRKIANTDPDRTEKLLELLETHPKIVVFYNFDYELEILRELSDIVPVAEWNGHRKQAIPDTDSWLYLVQYTAGAEGWNCISTDTMVFWSLTYSWKIFHQAKGRIDRLNTEFTDLYYFIFKSNSFIDDVVWKSLKRKKRFNESAFYDQFGDFSEKAA